MVRLINFVFTCIPFMLFFFNCIVLLLMCLPSCEMYSATYVAPTAHPFNHLTSIINKCYKIPVPTAYCCSSSVFCLFVFFCLFCFPLSWFTSVFHLSSRYLSLYFSYIQSVLLRSLLKVKNAVFLLEGHRIGTYVLGKLSGKKSNFA